MSEVVISIKPKHVNNILSGKKTVEIRVRNVNLAVGTRLWIYSTLPVGCVVGFAEIAFLDSGDAKDIWGRYKSSMCLERNEFDEYVAGRRSITTIGLKNVKLLREAFCLKDLRELESNFQPPQFYAKVSPERKIYSALLARACI